MKLKIPEKVKNIMQHLISHGYEAYIIGGWVRDKLLGLEPHDVDIFTNCINLKDEFPNSKILGGVERQAKILTVIVNGIEVSTFRSNGDRTIIKENTTLKQHCSTADFTINQICCDINGNIIDHFNGQKDLENKELRFVGKAQDRIKEDPLRILRGIRFLSKYVLFDYMNLTMNDIEIELNKLPKERISEELLKILKYERGLYILKNYKILDLIIPEFTNCRDMNGGEHHNETVDQHMTNAFFEACKLTDNVKLRLACLLHDIGKGETYSIEAIGSSGVQIHFYEHEKVGAELIEKRLSLLKFSNEDIKYITTLIRLHMWIHNTKEITKKGYIKFFNKLNDAKIPIEDVIILNYCDNQANSSNERVKFLEFLKCHRVLKKYYEFKYSEEPMTVKDLKISGKDVIEIFNVKPSPKIGIILNKVFELVMDGELSNTRAELLNHLKYGGMKDGNNKKFISNFDAFDQPILENKYRT